MSNAQLASEVTKAKGRVIIGLKDSAAVEGVDNFGRVLASANATAKAKEKVRSLGVEIEYEFKITPVVVGTIPSDVVAQIRSSPYVDYIEPDAHGSWEQQVTPWGVTRVQAPSAWSISTGSGVGLTILDSGIYDDPSSWPYHRDLSPIFAYRCIGDGGPLADQVGHGTHVSGIAAAIPNPVDVIGVGWGANLSSANVDGGGLPSTAQVACAIEVARANGDFVVNMSLSLTPSTAINDQIQAGYIQNGMLFVAAAGNTNGGPVTYPANHSHVIAVTATDMDNVRANFAAIGPEIDFAAPGVDILSTTHPGGLICTQGAMTGLCSGTSMAAPHVAAAAALVKSRFPTWTNAQVWVRLIMTATPLGPANQYGSGLIQTLAAVQ